MTALAFGLVLLALVYTLGPISGCHVNPAVTLGFVLARRMTWKEATVYWVAQLVGGVLGALALWTVLSGALEYDLATIGLGADGFGEHSMLGLNLLSALVVEVILTFLFVLVVLSVTSQPGTVGVAGIAIGAALAAVHLIGIPLTGTSVNPARSLGPAIVVGGDAFAQVWLFILGPLLGGALAALVWKLLNVPRPRAAAAPPGARSVEPLRRRASPPTTWLPSHDSGSAPRTPARHDAPSLEHRRFVMDIRTRTLRTAEDVLS